MFWAIFGTIISRIANAFYARTAHYKIPALFNELMSYYGALIGIIIIIFIGKFNIILFSGIDYLLIGLSLLIYFFQIIIDKAVYENEKISSLIPFQNLGKIISVFLGIIILGENTSPLSIGLFIIAAIIIFVSSVDFKSLKLSKYVIYYIGSEILLAIDGIIVGYVLIKNSSLDYFTSYIIILFSLLFIISIQKGYLKKYKTLDGTYHKSVFISSFSRLSWLITILMIKEMGLSMSVILSFLGIGVSLFMSYIMFKDVPTKKNLISTIVVTILIVLAFIYS